MRVPRIGMEERGAGGDPIARTRRGPWVIRMTWHDLLFAHWPVPPGTLRPLIPPALELDLFEGRAWLGIIPFRMSGVRLRACPPLPTVHAFPELNVRTYVRHRGRAGVWFLSLDAASSLAVAVARRWFHLNYQRCTMACGAREGWIHYTAQRRRTLPLPWRPSSSPTGPARFEGRYRPRGETFRALPATLEQWLTDRYCLFAADARGRLFRGDIAHSPWPLQRAEWEVRVNTLLEPLGLGPPECPAHLLYAPRLEVRAGPPRAMVAAEG